MVNDCVLLLSGSIASIGVLICTVEDLSRFHVFEADGLLSWQVMRLRSSITCEGCKSDKLSSGKLGSTTPSNFQLTRSLEE